MVSFKDNPMSDNGRKVTWGFLGAAGISQKNWASLQRSENGVLKMVGARELSRARSFIETCQASVPFEVVPQAVEGYEAILEDPEIDAVYIPLPTGLRKEWVIRAAEAGKHVMCEKPCAATVADLEEMIAACESHGVQFMDGVMFMHNRRFYRMLEVLAAGEELGIIRRVESCFSFFGGEEFESNIRLDPRLEPDGCLGDLGWYCIRLSLCAFQREPPHAVRGFLLQEKNGVPVEMRGDLLFDEERIASFHCSFNTTLEQSCRISGTEGVLTYDDFVQPFDGEDTSFFVTKLKPHQDGCNYTTFLDRKEVKVPGKATNSPDCQEALLFRTFGECVLAGTPDPSWPEISLLTQRVVEALRESAQQGGSPISLKE